MKKVVKKISTWWMICVKIVLQTQYPKVDLHQHARALMDFIWMITVNVCK